MKKRKSISVRLPIELVHYIEKKEGFNFTEKLIKVIKQAQESDKEKL